MRSDLDTSATPGVIAPGSAKWIGVDIENEGVVDTFKNYVWEPALLKVCLPCGGVMLTATTGVSAERSSRGGLPCALRR